MTNNYNLLLWDDVLQKDKSWAFCRIAGIELHRALYLIPRGKANVCTVAVEKYCERRSIRRCAADEQKAFSNGPVVKRRKHNMSVHAENWLKRQRVSCCVESLRGNSLRQSWPAVSLSSAPRSRLQLLTRTWRRARELMVWPPRRPRRRSAARPPSRWAHRSHRTRLLRRACQRPVKEQRWKTLYPRSGKQNLSLKTCWTFPPLPPIFTAFPNWSFPPFCLFALDLAFSALFYERERRLVEGC